MPNGLTLQEIYKIVNRYIGVTGGYLGDFSYRTHAEFYPEYCGLNIDPYTHEGTTRERFITIISQSSPSDQAKIIRGIAERFPVGEESSPSTRTNELRGELLSIASRLESAGSVPSPKPDITSHVVERAIADAEALLASTGAASGVDRLHTALHGYLLAACDRAGITYSRDPSLTQLYKALRQSHPALKDLGPRAGDINQVLRALASIIDVLQPVRNRASIAHPNPALLDPPEAMLVINAARTIIHYLDTKLSMSK